MASAVLLTGFWLVWPGPAEIAGDSNSYRDASPAAQTRASAGGLLTAAQASVAVSAKRELMAGAVAARNPFEETSRQVAATLPIVGSGGEPSAGLASSDVPDTTVNPPAKAAPESGGGGAGFVRRAIAAVIPEPAPSGGRPDGTTVAHLEAPAALVAPGRAPRRLPLWLRNAVAPAIDDRPAIAIVIDDLGVNRKGTRAVNHLDGPLTLAFLPYASDLSEQTRAARAAGHELLVHVPMEPVGHAWPGPNALLGSLEPADLISRLRSHLRSFRGFVGINNHMGSLLTTDSERMSLVMAELRRHGLLFLDSRTGSRSVAAREARRLHVPYAERDVFLDNELDLDAVLRQLALTERIARRWGQAVAIGHPRDVTIEALRRWLPTLDVRGFALVPISAIVARRSCSERVLAMAAACASYAAAASLAQ